MREQSAQTCWPELDAHAFCLHGVNVQTSLSRLSRQVQAETATSGNRFSKGLSRVLKRKRIRTNSARGEAEFDISTPRNVGVTSEAGVWIDQAAVFCCNPATPLSSERRHLSTSLAHPPFVAQHLPLANASFTSWPWELRPQAS